MDCICRCSSPLGGITLASDGHALTGLWFDGQKHFGSTLGTLHEEKALPVFDQTRKWLEDYFSGRIPDQTPPILLRGTDFQKTIWKQLTVIPYGETVTYGELAVLLGRERDCSRAVGQAVGRNPVSLIIPCHRVLGNGGKLTGYAGGTERKAFLLRLERENAPNIFHNSL